MIFDPTIGDEILDNADPDVRACLWRYLSRITSEHNQQPRYMRTIAWSVWAMCAQQGVARRLPTLFDIDDAVGVMLDMVGQWVGIPRRIAIDAETGFFSLNIPNLGFNEANWYGPDAATGNVFVLDDDDYRLVLQTRVLSNKWDGTREDAYTILNHYFGAKGYEVFIKDNYTHGCGWFTLDDPNPALGFEQGYWDQTDTATIHKCTGNMWMDLILYGSEPPSLLLLALFTGQFFDVKPGGVGINYWRNDPALPGVPMFGWDESGGYQPGDPLVHPYMAGWDVAAWALRIEPLQYRPARQAQPQTLMSEAA